MSLHADSESEWQLILKEEIGALELEPGLKPQKVEPRPGQAEDCDCSQGWDMLMKEEAEEIRVVVKSSKKQPCWPLPLHQTQMKNRLNRLLFQNWQFGGPNGFFMLFEPWVGIGPPATPRNQCSWCPHAAVVLQNQLFCRPNRVRAVWFFHHWIFNPIQSQLVVVAVVTLL